MESVRNFLESSTVHGLAYIATTRKLLRLFWITVVIAGFTGAGIIIHQSFESWDNSPVKTTIETLPITKISYPKVTVCPPKNTYTDLNYDLMMTKNMTIDDTTREHLENVAVELLYDHIFDTIMRNLSMLDERMRYYNWYNGLTKLEFPYDFGGVNFYIHSYALSGSISTKYFRDKFNADKVVKQCNYNIAVMPPTNIKSNNNITLQIQIDKIPLRDLSTGQDDLRLTGIATNINETVKKVSRNYTPPASGESSEKYLVLGRDVSEEDVINQKVNMMPGFNLTWHYHGMSKDTKQEQPFSKELPTAIFLRKVFYFLLNI